MARTPPAPFKTRRSPRKAPTAVAARARDRELTRKEAASVLAGAFTVDPTAQVRVAGKLTIAGTILQALLGDLAAEVLALHEELGQERAAAAERERARESERHSTERRLEAMVNELLDMSGRSQGSDVAEARGLALAALVVFEAGIGVGVLAAAGELVDRVNAARAGLGLGGR